MALTKVLQFIICSLGASFFAWAFFDPRFRDAEGFLEGVFCLPIAVGVALMVFGLLIAGGLRKAAFWFALALVGQAVALQLIEAGPFIRYQHYKPFDRLLTDTQPLLLLYLAAQTILVVAGFKTIWHKIRSWVSRNFRVWQLLGIGSIFFLSSATVSRDVPNYVFELFFAAFIQAINLGNIVLMARALPEETLASLKHGFEKLFGQPGRGEERGPGGIDRFAVLAALWVLVIAIVLNIFSYQRHPHIPDEVVYLYHARYLADGILTMPAPPVFDAFNIDLMAYEGNRWYSPVPPGWPLVLTIGVLLGAPWLVNPVLAAINILLAYLFIREIYDRRTARIAVFLLCVSPWYVFMAMNFMTHTFTLTCFLAASVAVSWARRTDKTIWGWVGGLAIGIIGLIRPLEGLAVAGLLGLWAIGVGGRRLKLPSIAALVLGSMIVGSAGLVYNKLITGDPLVFPIMAYTDKYYGPNTNALGFGPERGLGWGFDPYPGHGVIDALINADLNGFSVNIELFGWSTGSLILIAVMLFSGRMRRGDYLMLAVIAAISGIHTFYWFSGGPDFGARYWYLIIVPCALLTARGIWLLKEKFESGPSGSAVKSAWVIAAVLSLCIFSLVNYFPWRAIDKYYHYRGMRPDIRYLAEEYDFGRSLVLIRGNRHPDYNSAAVYNPLDLNADAPVYAWDRSPEVRAQVLKAYPDRPVWVVDGPTVTHGRFKVAQGPLSAHELTAKGGRQK